jgi:magnesium-dependent phosphatase 1
MDVDSLVQHVKNLANVPKLFVFDLDLTLWACEGTWIDTCSGPPFKLDTNSTKLKPYARARDGGKCTLYDQCWIILHALIKLKQEGADIKLAVASRTEEPDWARKLLRVLNIYDWFDYEEIYPTTKERHFESLRKRSGIEYKEMIFFDDEYRNIVAVSKIGVVSVFVDEGNGMSFENFLEGLKRFQ